MPRTPRSSASPYGMADGEREGPDQVLEFAGQAVEYVRRALGVTLEYNSETLPVLDHYLRQVGVPGLPTGAGRGPSDGAAPVLAADLVAATSGAYFGEVVRRRLGGSWHLPTPDPGSWRLVLPSGLWFFPVAMAMCAIVGPTEDAASAIDLDRDPDGDEEERFEVVDDEADPEQTPEWDASLQAPPPLRHHVERVLHGMADVSEEEFYSLCCRLDTLEHVQAVLAAMASAPRSHPDPDALD